MVATLPDGWKGRWLALSVTVAALALLWTAAVRPAIDWYGDRGEAIEAREALATRMAALAATLPELRRDAARRGNPAGDLLDGATDAEAAAALQERVGDMVGRSGATPTTLEVLPPRQNGAYREIGVRVTLSAPWSVLGRLLQALADASPRMLVDDVQVRGPPVVAGSAVDRPVDASLAILAFRAGARPSGGPGR